MSEEKTSKGKILVVDDVAETRTTLKGILEDEGYEVDVAKMGLSPLTKFNITITT